MTTNASFNKGCTEAKRHVSQGIPVPTEAHVANVMERAEDAGNETLSDWYAGYLHGIHRFES